MIENRHAHPHVDPRQPRSGAAPRTNPPVFVWRAGAAGDRQRPAPPYRLIVARDAGLRDVVLDVPDLTDPMFLPERAFQPGRYFWAWSAQAGRADTFAFDVAPDAVVLEVPPAEEWLKRLGTAHPRIFVRPEEVPALRESRDGPRAELWRRLRAEAEELLGKPHEMAEPPFLPDGRIHYRKQYEVWRGILQDSRRFVREALTLALAYLASGDGRCARAACRRMASICRWDPDGSSSIGHNDEAHMSVIWDGPQVCDWVWDAFTEEERQAVIRQFRRRGEINFEHMHDRGMYGVERFDSHAGREIVFLAQIAFVFHEHVPQAARWLQWLRPVLCGVWPIWAGDDGGWAQGPSYSTAYVGIQTMFATSLKRGAGVDMYRRPFWANHARWRQWCVPAYARWLGFGDNGYPPDRVIGTNADLVEIIARQTHSAGLDGYVAACRAAAGRQGVHPQLYIAEPGGEADGADRDPPPAAGSQGVLRVFPHAGLAAIRTHLDDPARDVALLFRSSPLGAISHSHADNNDFALHVAGEPLLIPSGYYAGYGSPHHVHWLWHTRSHNCVTLSDAGQRMRCFESAGAVECPFEDDRLAYLRGTADASYDLAERCRRHVVFLKPHGCFVLIDEFVPAAGTTAGLQWNVHAFEPFQVDRERRTFRVSRAHSAVTGEFLFHADAFFVTGEGFDPPPLTREDRKCPNQHHLRFCLGRLGRANLGTVLLPAHAALAPPDVAAERCGGAELARIGQDLVCVNQGGGIEYEAVRSHALAVVVVAGRTYEVTDDGLIAETSG